MVVSLDRYADGFHRQHHLAAQILHAVDGRSRKISLFLPRLMAQVGGLLCTGVPSAFIRIDLMHSEIYAMPIAHLVENERLRIRYALSSIANAGAPAVHLDLI